MKGGKTYHDGKCRQCNRDECKRRYRLNRDRYKQNADAYREKFYPQHKDKLRQIVVAAKEKPCVDCGRTYPTYVMDLDHVRGKKRLAVSRLVSRMVSEAALREEIAKCDVVCSNCHRERTFGDKNDD